MGWGQGLVLSFDQRSGKLSWQRDMDWWCLDITLLKSFALSVRMSNMNGLSDSTQPYPVFSWLLVLLLVLLLVNNMK